MVSKFCRQSITLFVLVLNWQPQLLPLLSRPSITQLLILVFNMFKLICPLCLRVMVVMYVFIYYNVLLCMVLFFFFRWNTYVVDGHSVEELCKAFWQAQQVQGKPTCIVAKTFKGKGLKS